MLYDGTKARDLFFELYDWLEFKTYQFMACNAVADNDPLKETEQIIRGQIVDLYDYILFGREDLRDNIRARYMKDKLQDIYYLWCEMRRLSGCFSGLFYSGPSTLENCHYRTLFTGRKNIMVYTDSHSSQFAKIKSFILKYMNDGYPDNDIDEEKYLDIVNQLINEERELNERCLMYNETYPHIDIKSSSYEFDYNLDSDRYVNKISTEELRMFELLFPGRKFNYYLIKDFYSSIVNSAETILVSTEEIKGIFSSKNTSLDKQQETEYKERIKPFLNSVRKIEKCLKNYNYSWTVKYTSPEELVTSKKVWKLYTDLVASTEVLRPRNLAEYKTMLMSPSAHSVEDLNSSLRWPSLNNNLLNLVNGLNDLYIVLDKIKVQPEN